jgi:hypothetical protein
MRFKMTPEERKKRRGEREWKRRQEEAKFYSGFHTGYLAFTRPGPPPVAAKAPEPKPGPKRPRAKPRPAFVAWFAMKGRRHVK